MSDLIGHAVTAIVILLLAATIVQCGVLDRRLQRLRADEAAMRETIQALVTATDGAERAAGALRATAIESERTLTDRLKSAERRSSELQDAVAGAEDVMRRIGRIVSAAGATMSGPAPAAIVDVKRPEVRSDIAAAAMAESLAERARRRLAGAAS